MVHARPSGDAFRGHLVERVGAAFVVADVGERKAGLLQHTPARPVVLDRERDQRNPAVERMTTVPADRRLREFRRQPGASGRPPPGGVLAAALTSVTGGNAPRGPHPALLHARTLLTHLPTHSRLTPTATLTAARARLSNAEHVSQPGAAGLYVTPDGSVSPVGLRT